jgi:hypothetical protein
VDKSELPREAYAYAPGSDRESWKLPHHFVREGTMYLHRGGVVAAWSALNGARTGKPMSLPANVRRHLEEARRALGLEEREGGVLEPGEED